METNAFASLAIWRTKMQTDLSESLPTGGRPEAKLKLLLEQSKDVEQGVLGCLKDSLFELREGVEWGLLEEGFAEQQRQQLYNHAATELVSGKHLCLELAREHGVLEKYCRGVKKELNHTVRDYNSIGHLKFAMAVWRANLQVDTSVATDGKELEHLLREGYYEGLRLIKRCGRRSLRYWTTQQKEGAPSESALESTYAAATERAQRVLLELAAQHGHSVASLQDLFGKVSGPDAVSDVEGRDRD